MTVVVSSRDRADRLASALPAVMRSLGPEDEVVVVDSASTGDSTLTVARAAGVKALRLDRPGLSRARNAGVRAATSDVVAFTDDDCSPAADWIECLRRHFEDPRIAFVTGRVEAVGDGEQHASVLDHEEAVRFDGPRDPFGMGHGANMAFRRDVLLDLGLFDEELGSGARFRSGEDADMLFRCMAAGWHGAYDPEALVSHEQWRPPSQMLPLRFGYGVGNGAYRAKAVRRRQAGVGLVLRSFWHHAIRGTAWSARRRAWADVRGQLHWTRGMVVGLVRGARQRLDGPNFGPPS